MARKIKNGSKTEEWLKNSVTSAVVFILGFIMGTVVDIFFYQIYIKWDPKESDLRKLMTVITAQILILTTILSYENTFSNLETLNAVVFRMSLVTSQIFMVKYALERISDIIYRRADSKKRFSQPPEKSGLEDARMSWRSI